MSSSSVATDDVSSPSSYDAVEAAPLAVVEFPLLRNGG